MKPSIGIRVALALWPLVGPLAAGEPQPLRIADAVVTLSEQIDVPARSAGVLAEMQAREGMQVTVGQIVAKIDDAEARLTAEHAEVELAAAKSEAGNELRILATEKAAAAARAELQRAKESAEKYSKSISETELDRLRLQAEKSDLEHLQARHEREQARLKVRVKENELETTRKKLELHQIVAPTSGVVVELKRRRGEWVEPGMPVFRIVTMDPLRVEAFLDARRAEPKLLGAAVRFVAEVEGGQPSTTAGRVTFISPEIDPINGQVRIWAEIPNADLRLRPGMQGVLEIGAASPAPDVGRSQPAGSQKGEPIVAPKSSPPRGPR